MLAATNSVPKTSANAKIHSLERGTTTNYCISLNRSLLWMNSCFAKLLTFSWSQVSNRCQVPAYGVALFSCLLYKCMCGRNLWAAYKDAMSAGLGTRPFLFHILEVAIAWYCRVSKHESFMKKRLLLRQRPVNTVLKETDTGCVFGVSQQTRKEWYCEGTLLIAVPVLGLGRNGCVFSFSPSWITTNYTNEAVSRYVAV